jgi:hypothetical protein
MLAIDGNATGFDKGVSYTTLQHCVVLADANVQFSQHSLKKLLLGEGALTPISCQSSRL